MKQIDKIEKHLKERGYEYTKLECGGFSLKSEYYELKILMFRRKLMARLLHGTSYKETAYGVHMAANMADIFVEHKDLIDSIEKMNNETLGLTEQFKIEHDKHNLCEVKYEDIDFSFRTVIVPMALGFEPSRYTAPVECHAYIGDGSSRKFMARSCGSDLKELFRKVTQEALDVSIHELQKAYGTTQSFRDIKTITAGQK